MTDTQSTPPHVAQAFLRALLNESDSETITGDLLEEYREVRRPSLGRVAADWWYVKHVLSVMWQIVWPCFVAIVALRILSFPLPRGWNPSLVPAPGVSLLDALVMMWAGFYGSQRTGRLMTGIITSGATSVVGVTIFFVYAAVRSPSLLMAPFEKPFIFVIVATLMALAIGFGLVLGTVGAVVGRSLPPTFVSRSRRRAARPS